MDESMPIMGKSKLAATICDALGLSLVRKLTITIDVEEPIMISVQRYVNEGRNKEDISRFRAIPTRHHQAYRHYGRR